MVEKADAWGDWNAIGYTGPGTSSAGGSESTAFSYIEGKTAVPQWTAKPLQKLNNCAAGTTGWTLSAYVSYDSESGQGNTSYSVGGTCRDLTPAFDKLISGREHTGT